MTFTDAFDVAYITDKDMESTTKMNIPLKMMTDSRYMFDVLTKASCCTEKRLMIYFHTVKDAYQSFKVNYVEFIRS